jgi:superfamily II DNA or RNA helicase
MLKKNELTEEILINIKNELTVKPLIDNKYCIKIEDTSFKIYQEGKYIILLPRYYGIKNFGYPNIINMDISNQNKTNLTFNGILRDYQIEIINKCKQYLYKNNKLLPFGGGIISVAPGKGKTCMALYLCQLIGYKTLIIVHKTFLINQWLERIKQYLPNARVGIIQQNKIDIENKDIVIGMLQSIALKNYDDDIFESFPIAIFDEVHHLGAKVFSRALFKIQSQYTLGLSATPNRKDGLEKVFYWNLGEIIWEQAAEVDHTVQIKIYNYNLSKSNKLFKPVTNYITKQVNISKMITNLTELKIRNKFIINLINQIFPIIPETQEQINQNQFNNICIKKITKKNHKYINFDNINILEPIYINKSRKLLILSNRIEHLKQIENLLTKYNNKWKYLIGYYIGGLKEKQLKIAETKPLILATFEMASEGLDISDLDTLILSTPKSNVTQSIGRILRTQQSARKYKPIIYDIVDNISIFIAQGKKRYIEYNSKEYNIEWFNVNDNKIFKTNNSHSDYIDYNINQFIDDDELY